MSLFDRDGKRKYLNAPERLRFYQRVRLLPSLELRAFLLTLIFTGCRISEALNMRWGDVDFSERILVFRTLKQRLAIRYRALPIPDELLDLFCELAVDSDDKHGEMIWQFSRTTAWRRVKEQMKMSGLDGIKATPKGLRHGYATANVSKGVPINKVQTWMGHELPRTTAIYLDFIGDEERELAERAWPNPAKTAI